MSFGVSFVTVTTTFFVIVSSVGFPSAPGLPVPFDVIVTGIVTSLLVSPVPNVTSGVPTRFPFSSTLKPFVDVDVIVAPVLFGVTTFVLSATFSPFLTVGFLISASKASNVFGFLSWSFGIPSPSLSGSVVSGVPSPSVSLCTVILNVSSDSFPASSFAFTVTVKSFVSSLPQSFTVGVPVIFPVPLSNVKPSGSPVTVTSAFGSSVVTVISSIGFFSITVLSSGFVITGAVVSFTVTVASTLSVEPSL